MYVKFPCYQKEPRFLEVLVRWDQKFCNRIKEDKANFCKSEDGFFCDVNDDCGEIARDLVQDASKALEGQLNVSLKIHGGKTHKHDYGKEFGGTLCPWRNYESPTFERSDALNERHSAGDFECDKCPIILFTGCQGKHAAGIASGALTGSGHVIAEIDDNYTKTLNTASHELGHGLGADDFNVGSEGFMGRNIIKPFGTMNFLKKTKQYSYEETRNQLCTHDGEVGNQSLYDNWEFCAKKGENCKCDGIVQFYYLDSSEAKHPLAKRMAKNGDLKCDAEIFGESNKTHKDADGYACRCSLANGSRVSCGGHFAESCEKCGKWDVECNGECGWKGGKCQKKIAPGPLPLSISDSKKEIDYLDVREDDKMYVLDPVTQTTEEVYRKNPYNRRVVRDLDCSEQGVKYDLPPENIVGTHKHIGSWNSCQKKCNNKNGCFYWTWSKDTRDCNLISDHMKSSLVKKDNNYVSGPKSCYPNTDQKIAGESCNYHAECKDRFCKNGSECEFRKGYGEECTSVHECRAGLCSKRGLCEPNSLENDNQICDYECNGRAGPCNFCGSGSCCQRGKDDNIKGCRKGLGRDAERSCVPRTEGDIKISSSVDCGGHDASSCERCATFPEWCNTDCTWKGGKCQSVNKKEDDDDEAKEDSSSNTSPVTTKAPTNSECECKENSKCMRGRCRVNKNAAACCYNGEFIKKKDYCWSSKPCS